MQTREIILASASPRRRELLAGLGVEFRIVHTDLDESPMEEETAKEHAIRLARAKARAVLRDHDKALIIGADTIVTIDGEILGKPADKDDARRMLALLSGRTHTVVTAYSAIDAAKELEETKAIETLVTVKELTKEEINNYVETGEPMDKAGSYAIQGQGKFIVESIEGSYTNVVGLPTEELRETLSRAGVVTKEAG